MHFAEFLLLSFLSLADTKKLFDTGALTSGLVLASDPDVRKAAVQEEKQSEQEVLQSLEEEAPEGSRRKKKKLLSLERGTDKKYFHIQTQNADNDAAPKGMEFIGIGYDTIFGNPSGGEGLTQIDPGFRDPIIKHDTAASGCPGNVLQLNEHTCNHQSRATEVASSDSLQESLDVSASLSYAASSSVSGDVGAFSASASKEMRFSASAGYKSDVESMEDESKEYMETNTLCTEYRLKFARASKQNFQPDFVTQLTEMQAVKYENCTTKTLLDKCPDGYQKWIEFIRKFGTAVIDSVDMGAKRLHKMEFLTKDVTEMKAEGIDVSMEAAAKVSGSAGGFGAEAEASVDVEAKAAVASKNDNRATVNSKSTNEFDINIGGTPDADWRVWTTSISDKPMPVAYSFTPLPLWIKVQEQSFSGLANLDATAKTLSEAINGYAERFGNKGTQRNLDDPDLLVASDGTVTPKLLRGLIRDNGKRLDGVGGMFVSQKQKPAGMTISLVNEEFAEEKKGVVVASGITKGFTTFTPCSSDGCPAPNIVSACTKGGECKKALNLVIGNRNNERQENPGCPISFISGVIVDSDLTFDRATIFGLVGEEGTTQSGSEKAFTATTQNGVTTLSLPALGTSDKLAHLPAVVATAAFLKSDDLKDMKGSVLGSVPVICGIKFDTTNKAWNVKVAHRKLTPSTNAFDTQDGFNFLATNINSGDNKVSWAVVSQQRGIVSSHNMAKTKSWENKIRSLCSAPNCVTSNPAEYFTWQYLKTKGGWDDMDKVQRAQYWVIDKANYHNIFREKLDEYDQTGYTELKFREAYKTTPSCAVTAIYPTESSAWEKKLQYAFAHNNPYVWKKHGYWGHDNANLFLKWSSKTAQECKTACEQNEFNGDAAANKKNCVGFTRYHNVEDEDQADCWFLDEDDFQSTYQDTDEVLFYMDGGDNPDPAQCGDGSGAELRGINQNKVAVATSNRDGMPKNRGFAVVCIGEQ